MLNYTLINNFMIVTYNCCLKHLKHAVIRMRMRLVFCTGEGAVKSRGKTAGPGTKIKKFPR